MHECLYMYMHTYASYGLPSDCLYITTIQCKLIRGVVVLTNMIGALVNLLFLVAPFQLYWKNNITEHDKIWDDGITQ